MAAWVVCEPSRYAYSAPLGEAIRTLTCLFSECRRVQVDDAGIPPTVAGAAGHSQRHRALGNACTVLAYTCKLRRTGDGARYIGRALVSASTRAGVFARSR
jgi:hypothetical protein